jgi:hypothetical protein
MEEIESPRDERGKGRERGKGIGQAEVHCITVTCLSDI